MTLKELLSREFSQNLNRDINQGMSRIHLLGGFSRAIRYPQEGVRQLGGLGKYGLGALSGMDKDKLQQILQEYQEPMYMNEDEWSKMTGKSGVFSPLLEGAAAGADVGSWALPIGQMGSAIQASAAEKIGGKLIPWLLGKAGSGAIAGLPRGLAMSDVSEPETILPNMGKSAGLSAGINVGVGALQEGLKALGNVGTRTTARSLGLGEKGDTTTKMGEKIGAAKKSEGLAASAQGQLDKGSKRAGVLTQKKIEALNRTDVKDLEAVKSGIKQTLKQNLSGQLNSSDLESASLVGDISKRIDTATSLRELDDIAIEAGNKATTIGGKYDPVGSPQKQIFDATRDSIVKTLKGISKNYGSAKSGLSDVLSRINAKELTNKAFVENKGMGAPLFLAGSEIPIGRQLWSVIGSGIGAAERGLGKLGTSDVANKAMLFGANQIGQQPTPSGTGQQQGVEENNVIDLAEVWGNIGDMGDMQQGMGGEQMGGSMTPGYGLGLSQSELMGSQQQSQQPTQQINMQELAMRLMEGISSGQISATDAEMIIGLAGVAQGGSLDQYKDKQNSTDTSKLSMGGLNARSAWEDLLQINEQLEGGRKSVKWTSLLPKEGGDPEMQKLDNAIRNITDTIARTRTGAAMNLKEEELYRDFAPTTWDKEESRINKIQRLERLFRLVMENEGIDVDSLSSGGQRSSIVDDYNF